MTRPTDTPSPAAMRAARTIKACLYAAQSVSLSAQDVEMMARIIAEETADLREACAFAMSAIKSGEDWTPTCEDVIGSALARHTPRTREDQP